MVASDNYDIRTQIFRFEDLSPKKILAPFTDAIPQILLNRTNGMEFTPALLLVDRKRLWHVAD